MNLKKILSLSALLLASNAMAESLPIWEMDGKYDQQSGRFYYQYASLQSTGNSHLVITCINEERNIPKILGAALSIQDRNGMITYNNFSYTILGSDTPQYYGSQHQSPTKEELSSLLRYILKRQKIVIGLGYEEHLFDFSANKSNLMKVIGACRN